MFQQQSVKRIFCQWIAIEKLISTKIAANWLNSNISSDTCVETKWLCGFFFYLFAARTNEDNQMKFSAATIDMYSNIEFKRVKDKMAKYRWHEVRKIEICYIIIGVFSGKQICESKCKQLRVEYLFSASA